MNLNRFSSRKSFFLNAVLIAMSLLIQTEFATGQTGKQESSEIDSRNSKTTQYKKFTRALISMITTGEVEIDVQAHSWPD